MLIELLILLAAAIFLAYSSDWFTGGASKLARIIGVSEFMIGMTVVAIGTSLPEIAVSAYSSMTGNAGIAVGNIIGSNITNVALILGTACLFYPIIIDSSVYRDAQIHVLILAAASCCFLYNNMITRMEGALLVMVYAGYLLYGYSRHRSLHTPDLRDVKDRRKNLIQSVIQIIVGAAGIFVACNALVDNAIKIASELGISPTIIGLTLVALGTSLPELAVSIAAARKKQGMLILGNIIGSNIANILLALGIGAGIRTIQLTDDGILVNDIVIMVFLAMAIVIFIRSRLTFDRRIGMLFIMVYVMFIAMTFM